MNSEATLNCNGKEFKCVNATHYQPCSLVERSGAEPMYTINGVILPCLNDQKCNDQTAVNCAIASRTIESENIPVVPVVVANEPKIEVSSTESAGLRVAAVEENVVPDVKENKETVSTPEVKNDPSPTAETVANVSNETAAATKIPTDKDDQTKAVAGPVNYLKAQKPFKPIRLVNGFRAATWRPKISLDQQKDVADTLRQKSFERRNKYETFVNAVLGKASPVPIKKPLGDGKDSGKSKTIWPFFFKERLFIASFLTILVNVDWSNMMIWAEKDSFAKLQVH